MGGSKTIMESKKVSELITMEKLWLNEAIIKFNKKFHKNVLNILNAPAGCGKSTFILEEFLTESYKYVEHLKNTKECYQTDLNKVLYVCDTNMLKSSILQENKDKGITKILEKGDLKKAMEGRSLKKMLNNETGEIKVVTYSTLGWLLQQPGSRYILLNHFKVILMDEMQNLFKYSTSFDTEENGKPYGTVINYLSTIAQKLLLIALSATPERIYSGVRELSMLATIIFSSKELEQIRSYQQKYTIKCNYLINKIKEIGINKKYFDEHKYKVYIYTNTIRMSIKYKKQLEKYGFKAEWLCSINNKTINEDKEIIPTMNEYQLSIRNKLLKDGTLPDDLDVIIVNSGYETGWNLRDERVQYAYIDSKDEDTQIQARNRIRHNIIQLIYTVITDKEGRIFEYGRYRELMWTEETMHNSFLQIELDSKYLGKKLFNHEKYDLVDMYAIIQIDKKEANWKSFQIDLEHNNYVMDKTPKGTYIYTKEEFEKIEKSRREVIKVDELFINWLENEWDKKRIARQDVMDQVDIGIKSFKKLIKSDKIIKYFKDHRYKISAIKDCETIYLMKY